MTDVLVCLCIVISLLMGALIVQGHRLAKLAERAFDSALAISAEELERRRIDKPYPAPMPPVSIPNGGEYQLSRGEAELLGMGIRPDPGLKPNPMEGVMVGGSPN